MRKSLSQLKRIWLLWTAIEVALVLFPVTAHAGSGFFGANKSAILVYIDKTNQQMTVSLDNVEKYRWPVSTGKAGYSTPSGTYTATSMNEVWYSKEYDNAPMPHAVFFMKDGHAIHGTFEVKNSWQTRIAWLVRISPQNAAILYGLVQENGLENTKVVLTGSGSEVSISRQGSGKPAWGFSGPHPTPLIATDPGSRLITVGLFTLVKTKLSSL